VSDLPPPDLLDSTGRLRRFAVSLVLSSVVAALVYALCTQLSEPDRQATTGGYKFVFYMTALAFAVVFAVSLKIQTHLADKKYRESLGPPSARVKR